MPDDFDAYLDPPKKPRDRVHSIASRAGIPPDLADDYLKVTNVESGHNINVRDSSKGAKGFGQVMPDRPGGTTRTIGRRKYNLKDPDQNIEAGLRYFAEGGNDPVARRLHYFGGPGARKRYERTGRIPNISDGNMSAAQYVKATGAQSAVRTPQQSKGELDDYLDPLDDYLDAPASPTPTPQTKPKRSRFEGVRAGAQGEAVREYPAMQARRPGIIERATEAIKPYVPGLISLDTPAGLKLDAPRGFIRGVTLGATGESRPITREDLLVDQDAEAKRNFAEGAGETIGAVVPYIGAGKVLSKVPALAKATRAAHIARNAATFGGVEAAREGINAIKTGESPRPEEIAISTGIGAAMGGIAGVSPSMKRQVVAFLAPQIAVDVARGTPMEQALQAGLTNLGFALTSGARGKTVIKAPRIRELRARLEAERVKEDARQTETQRQGVSQEQPAEATQGVETLPTGSVVDRGNVEAISDTARVQPQRFYHTQYGNVVQAADQTGARKGKTKVYVEGNPEEIHYPKTVDLRGRGNERMVPLKESVEVLPEAPAEKPQQPPETKGATVAPPSPPETLRVEPQVVKPWEMSRSEIESEFQRKKSEDNNLEVVILGPELAKRYGRLQRTANSSTVPPEKADAAYAEIEKIEASLSERDRNRLYGIGETGPQVEDLRAYRQSLGNLDDSSPQSLGESMRWAVSRVGNETDPVKMNQEQQIAFGTLREAARIAHENGWDTRKVSEIAVKAAGERFADPEDARMMLDRFLTKEPAAARAEPKQIAPPKVSEQPIKEVINEATAPVTRPESTIVSEGAGLGALDRGTEPAPSKRRTKPHDTLVTGERSDLSLSQFVRKRGGIVPGEMFAGELDRLRSPDTGTTGLVNQRNVRGGRKMTADYMMEAANEAGFKDPQTGEKFDNVGNFLYAVERDVSTKNIKALTGTEVNFETEYRKHVDAQMAEAKDRDNAIKSADALVSLLEGGRGGELFDKIAANNATPAEQAELRSLARKRFIRTAELEDVIAEAKAEGLSTSFEGERAATPSRTERAEQLGFVQEGLTQESASLPPKEVDQRARLIQEEKQRQRERNPERAAALDTLATLREKGMTVDEYARQGSLIGETPSRRKLALLRELESGNFGPGAASAKEPFPEVKERKFGKRFVEDERIAQEIRDSIGTAKYYEPIPNKITAADAKKLVDERGVGQSINAIKDEGNNIPFHVRVAMGEIVALRTNKAYKNLKETNPKEAEFILEQANETAEFLMDYGTRLGQGVQAYKMWSQQTPEGILLTYQKAVAKARQRHQAKVAGEEVKEIVDTVNKEMSHEERVQELKKLFTTNKTARKVRSQMDQLLKAAKDRKLEDKDFYDIVGDRLGLPKYDPKVASRIMSLAEQIADAPEGLPRDRKILQLNKYLAEQKGFDVGDLPIGIYYGNILSGYNTQIVNSVDTALNVISEINGLAINNPRAAAKIYGGLLRGFSEGKLDAILTLTEGRMVTDGKWLEVPRLMEIAEFGKKGGVPISTATRRGRAMKSIAESKAGYPLNAYKYVTRMLAASDAVMFRSAKEARASLLAHRMAEAEGLTGDALDAKVRSILALDRRADFEKQAEREGFTGTAAKVRTAELIDMVRNKEVSSDAADFAGEATYNHKPHGALGYASDVVGKWSEQYKPLKLFVPFTRIVANVTNRGLNWTPYGFKRAAWGYSQGEVLTPEARRLMITRATLGTVGLVTLGALQEAGLLQIHGAGPSDREKKRQLQNAGWRPYSIQIGSTYVSYVYSPTGLGLSIVGNMSDSQRYHELEQKDAATRGAYAIARLGSTVFSQSFLSGLSRLFNALSESPSESVTAVKQTMSSTVAAITTPNLARDVYRLFDNKTYQSNTLVEDLIRNTPFAALALKPQLNAFGEPVRVQRQRFFDVQTSDPAWQFVIQKGLKVPVPGRTLEIGKDERITPEQYYELLAVTGPRVKQWVVNNRARLSKMKEDDAQDELTQAATRIRKFELARMRLLARRKKVA